MGVIDLRQDGLSVRIDDEISSRNFCIQIQTNTRKYFFAAESQYWMDVWLKALKSKDSDEVVHLFTLLTSFLKYSFFLQLLKIKEEHYESDRPKASRIITMAPGVSAKRLKSKQGFLYKRGHMVKNWKTRWFDLYDGKISYFRTPQVFFLQHPQNFDSDFSFQTFPGP